jgi:peptide/nickel transport system ATP-binding protein
VNLLEIRNLQVRIGEASIVDVEELTVEGGRHLAIVGESGSGKTMTAMSLVGLQTEDAEVSGSIRIAGEEIVDRRERELRSIRGRRVGVVFQDPLRALNPTMRVGRQVEEALRLHGKLSRRARQQRVRTLLERVRLPDPEAMARRYPHELSGGQRQRVLIAGAIAWEPELLIADEPTTALDVTVQRQILELLQELSTDADMSVVLVSHNLGVVQSLCDEVAVMYGGRVVECGPVDEIIARPRHRYTKALIDANPRFDPGARWEGEPPPLRNIPGTVPAAGHFPEGCPFRGRCDAELGECATMPAPTAVDHRHAFRCWNPVSSESPASRAEVAGR